MSIRDLKFNFTVHPITDINQEGNTPNTELPNNRVSGQHNENNIGV